MKRILAIAFVALTALAGVAQTEVRTIDRHDYARIDTMFTTPDARAFRFVLLAGRDSTLSILDTYRHWMSPKFWKLSDPLNVYVRYLCDNTTTSLFEIEEARPGENWLVTLSGDKIVLPSYTHLETTNYGMITLNYGGDRFWANRDGYAVLRTKARNLVSKIDNLNTWQRQDSLGRVLYQIDWPTDSSVLSQNVRQWISERMSACNPEAYERDSTDQWPTIVIDARQATDSSQVVNGYAEIFFQGLAKDSVNPNLPHHMHLMVLRRSVMKDFVTYSADGSWYTGGAHDHYDFTYGTFSRTTGRLLTSASVVKPEATRRVSEMIADEVDKLRKERGIYQGPAPLTHEAADGSKRLLVDTNVGFLPSGVVFTYQRYDIGSFAEGAYFIVIPWSRITPYLQVVPVEYK